MFSIVAGTTTGVSPSVVNSVLATTQLAADYWGRYLDASAVTLTIEVSFQSLPSGVLARGGTDFYFSHTAGGLDYFKPASTNKLAGGADLNGSNADISIDVNTDILNSAGFSFGQIVDGYSIGQSGKYDLWTVLVHEIAHGFGMLSFIGASPTNRTTFDQFVSQVNGNYFFTPDDPAYSQVALDAGIGHTASGVLSPATTQGVANYLSQNDLGIFATLGAPMREPTSGADLLGGFSNSTILDGLGGNDTILGLAGNEHFRGGLGADSLSGSLGDDTLSGGAGSDTLNGGSGADTANYAASASGVTVKIWAGTGAGGDAAGDTLIKVENLVGSAFDDRLIGLFNQNNDFRGGAGNDYFDGFAGADSLYGEAGDDRIIGGAGGDQIDGGAGTDIASYGSSQSAINVQLWNNSATGGDATGDTLVSVEGVIGSAFADTIAGGAGYNVLQGNGGADLLDGRDGYDFLNGGNGNDTVIGGAGNDTLKGGLHDDVFRFAPGHGADRIDDFGVGGATGNDVIELQGYGPAFDTFAEVMAVATQQGADTLINFGGGNSIQILNLNVSALNPADFLFS